MSMTARIRRRFGAVAALALTAAALSGCVYYPNNYAYGYGPGYYAAPVVVQPSVVVGGWWGGGCCWGGWRGGRWR
jgi:hypothetical protein